MNQSAEQTRPLTEEEAIVLVARSWADGTAGIGEDKPDLTSRLWGQTVLRDARKLMEGSKS